MQGLARAGGWCPRGHPRRACHDHEVPLPPPAAGRRTPEPREGPRPKGVLRPRRRGRAPGSDARIGNKRRGTTVANNLLVGHYQRHQPEQRVERELQQWEREQRQQEQRQLRSGSAVGLVTRPEEPYAFRALWQQYRPAATTNGTRVTSSPSRSTWRRTCCASRRSCGRTPIGRGRSICFVTGGPKPRDVFAADFRDRLVHHLLVSRQEPVFERRGHGLHHPQHPSIPHEEAGPLVQRNAARRVGLALDPCFLPAGRIGDGRTGRASAKIGACGRIRVGQLPGEQADFFRRDSTH
jgi:hypothetical protein